MLHCETIERQTDQGAPWTDEATERLAVLYFKMPKLRIEDIADRLGRTVSSVYGQISRTGMSAPGAQLRVCLGECFGQRFYSSWIGHRRCRSCSRMALRYAS
jgi:hypothetical protein